MNILKNHARKYYFCFDQSSGRPPNVWSKTLQSAFLRSAIREQKHSLKKSHHLFGPFYSPTVVGGNQETVYSSSHCIYEHRFSRW